MRINVYFTPNELRRPLTGRIAVVIDVLRATSTMTEALANGARSIYPTASAEEAVRLAGNLGRSEVLLCGERKARRIEGFDLGNSPREFTRDVVADKVLVMSTTNGTPALLTGAAADRCIVGSFLNIGAVAAELAESDKPVAMLCSGREGRFAFEDALYAGVLLRALHTQKPGSFRLNDAALAATALERRYRRQLLAAVSHTSAARQIVDAGLTDDIVYCLTENRHSVVPVLSGRQVTL